MASVEFYNHADLVDSLSTYQGIADFEDGRVDAVVSYLVPHASETDGTAEGAAQFANRRKRLHNINYVSPYLTIHWSHCSQPHTYGGLESDALQAIQADATGYREDATQVARARLWYYMRDGRVGTYVDGPSAIADDRATARATGERSYQVLYEARKIRYWEHFTSGARKGQLSEVILEERPVRAADGKTHMRYRRLFFEDKEAAATNPDATYSWQILEDQSTSKVVLASKSVKCDVKGEGTGGINEIPFVIMGDGPDESFAKDTWALNKAHMNLESVVSNILHNQGFQRTAMAGVTKEEVTKIAEWTYTLLQNPEARIFTIEAGSPDGCFREVERIERQLHRRAKFEFNQLADDTRQTQSAESKAKDLIVQKAIYDNTLDMLQGVEASIYRLHALYEGEKDTGSISCSIARDYGLEDEMAEQQQLQLVFAQAQQLGVTDLQKEILKMQAARLRYIPNESETEAEVRERIMQAIAAANNERSTALDRFGARGLSFFGAEEQPEQ